MIIADNYFALIEKAKVQNNTLHSHVPHVVRTQHILCKLSLSRRQGQKPSSPISALCIQTSCPKTTRMYVGSSYINEGTLQGMQLCCWVGARPRPGCLADRGTPAGLRALAGRLSGHRGKEAAPRAVTATQGRKKRGNRPARTRKNIGVFGDGQIKTTGRKTVL